MIFISRNPDRMNVEHEMEYDELEEVLDAYAANSVDWNPEPSSVDDGERRWPKVYDDED